MAPWLLVGPALDAAGYAHLAHVGVTHVLDLRSEDSDDPGMMESLGLSWRRVPIDDRAAPTPDQLAEITAWLESAEAGVATVYIHCQGGLGRSPTVATALLMQKGFSRAESHRLVFGARSVAAPTEDQAAWLADLDSETTGPTSSLPPRRDARG